MERAFIGLVVFFGKVHFRIKMHQLRPKSGLMASVYLVSQNAIPTMIVCYYN